MLTNSSNHPSNTKTIARNTVFLYFRMIVLMLVNLYTVRVVLHVLGETDYGIYNVVCGIVTMFSFLNSTLSTSAQRYFSVELARNNLENVNKWLCLNVTMFLGIAVIILLVAETIGLWFLNTQMTIPEDRNFAANVIYQISLVTFVANIITVPYNALIIAHEKMSAFAYISIIEALAKLAIVVLLPFVRWDHLIVYSILLMIVSCLITSSYIIYCRIKFSESKLRLYWDKLEAFQLLSFSGWHFLGTSSVVIRGQGINILINMFFNPTINAARAISYQVISAVNQLSANFFTAVKPQIYKTYAANDLQSLYSLVFRSTILCYFLVSLLAFPILTNTDYVLSLWLKDVPEYTVPFTQLVIVNGLIDSTNGPTIASALATGKIKKYELIISVLVALNLPVSYIFLKLGYSPYITVVISIVISLVSALVRAYLLNQMIGISLKKYLYVFIKLIVVSSLVLGILYKTCYNYATNLAEFILLSIFSVLLCTVLFYCVALDSADKKIVLSGIKKRIKRC